MIQKECFEKYQFPIPVKYLFCNKKNRFIVEELKRRHPCFSNKDAYDSKITFKGRKLSAIVLVVKKTKLAELYARCRINFFGFKASGIKFYRWFANRYTYLFFLFLLIVGLFIFFVSKQNSSRKVNEINLINRLSDNEETIDRNSSVCFDEAEMINREPKDEPISSEINRFFEIIRKENGRVTLFDYVKGDEIKVFLELNSVFPEKVSSLFDKKEISPVNYENKVPFYSITAFSRIQRNGAEKTEDNEKKMESNDFQVLIRNVLILNKVNLREERFLANDSSYSVKFSFIERNNVFNDIFLLMEDLNLAVKKFLIKSEKNNEFFVELSFEKADKIDDFRIFDIISKNLDLFFDNSIENQGVKNVNVKENLSENKENKKSEKNEIKKEKLGEVTDKSGRKTVFYKNQNGKIIQQIENE